MAARQKILILDDEHDILEIYQEILARLPSQPEIHTADNGARAIALLESEPFNLLLVDLRMPQMDGFQVLAIVRRKFPPLRVVVMTAAEDEQFRARAYAMGIDLYIEKPKTGKEIINFVDCIESLLEREEQGGFRGVQSKTLVDIIQLECLTQSSAILKITTATGEGRIWVQRGEIIDAATGDLAGQGGVSRNASLEIRQLRNSSIGHSASAHDFQLLRERSSWRPRRRSMKPPRPRLSRRTTRLAAFARYKGVQFAVAVETADKQKFEQWGTENAEQMAAWIHETATALRSLGDQLEAGQLEAVEGLGPQRHLAVLVGDDEALGVGFTRSAALPHIRETMKQIEAKWLS